MDESVYLRGQRDVMWGWNWKGFDINLIIFPVKSDLFANF